MPFRITVPTPAPPLHVPQIPPPPHVAQPPDDAVRTEDPKNRGRFIMSKALTAGVGVVHPGASDVVTAHYTAWTTDGTTIDDSRSRGKPAVWILNQLIEGLAWGIRLMVAGEKRRIWIPGAMGHEWATDMLVYDVELLAIAPPPAWPTPADMRSVPADATRLSSGLAFKVLRRGTGTERPKPMSTATLHYTAWTTNGTTIFDDTVARDAPMTAAVDTLIPGLSEGLQRMVVGERTRFWIPADLGYAPPLPRASTVFDVELLAIQRAADGDPGTVRIHSNSPDAAYTLILPDGTPQHANGPQTFPNCVPGNYRIEPGSIPLYAIGLVVSPADLKLAPGGTLDITIQYVPIVN